MNQLIFLCLIGAAWTMHTGNVNVVPSDVTQEQFNQSVDGPVHTREFPGVHFVPPSYVPGYKPVYNFVLSRSVPTFGSGHKGAGTSVPFYPYVITPVPVPAVADTGSYSYFPFGSRTNQAATTATADCVLWGFC